MSCSEEEYQKYVRDAKTQEAFDQNKIGNIPDTADVKWSPISKPALLQPIFAN